jgi:hypothetical protein
MWGTPIDEVRRALGVVAYAPRPLTERGVYTS